MVRIVPSPDWFVGIDSLDLCEGGRWKEQVVLDLYPHDAGTDSGFTFSSPNFATIPQDTVTEVSCLRPVPHCISLWVTLPTGQAALASELGGMKKVAGLRVWLTGQGTGFGLSQVDRWAPPLWLLLRE